MSFGDPYEVVLADLRAKRDEIENLIRSLEAFRPAPESPAPLSTLASLYGPSAPKQPSAVGPLYGMSIVDASKAVLRERGRPLPVGDIVVGLKDGGHVMNSEDPANTVSSVLNRAMQQGAGVVRVGRGIWALPEWSTEAVAPPSPVAAQTPPPPPPPPPASQIPPPPPPPWATANAMRQEALADDDIPF